MSKKEKKSGLNYKRTFLIGFGFMGCMLLWSVYNSYVPVMLRAKLTEVFAGGGAFVQFIEGHSWLAWLTVPLIVNAIMTIDNVFGVIFQPYFGKRSDRTHSKLGKRMPYIIIFMPICALFFCFVPVAATVKAAGLSILLMMCVIICFNLLMSVWRSPVVSLMPDFTPSHLQSDANAVINIMGGIGQMIGFVVGTIASAVVGLFGFTALSEALTAEKNELGQLIQLNESGEPVINVIKQIPADLQLKYQNFVAGSKGTFEVDGVVYAEKAIKTTANGEAMYVNYTPVFVVTAIIAILCLAVLVAFYIKNKKHDLSYNVEIEPQQDEGKKQKRVKIKNLPISKDEKKSLVVMLAALFLINNATEAIIPNFTNFADSTLNVKPIYSTLMMAVFAVSLAAFGIPAGMLGRKFGRKKTIIGGLVAIVAMFAVYLSVSQLIPSNPDGSVSTFTWVILWIALIVGGAAIGCVNINTLPLVLAIGGREYVGTFTGYYYTATFSAAVTGPILCGLVIGLFNEDYNFMFLFCAIMFAVGLAVITQVKHGEVSAEDEEWLEKAVEEASDD